MLFKENRTHRRAVFFFYSAFLCRKESLILLGNKLFKSRLHQDHAIGVQMADITGILTILFTEGIAIHIHAGKLNIAGIKAGQAVAFKHRQHRVCVLLLLFAVGLIRFLMRPTGDANDQCIGIFRLQLLDAAVHTAAEGGKNGVIRLTDRY